MAHPQSVMLPTSPQWFGVGWRRPETGAECQIGHEETFLHPFISHGIARVRALLDHTGCPTAFPVVRTRFLGTIATPRLDASSVQTVASLWGGQLPTFDTAAAANELFEAARGRGTRAGGLGADRLDVPELPGSQ